MSVLIILVIVGILVAGSFLVAFVWSVKDGQYDDMTSPAVRILFEDTRPVGALGENSSHHKKNKRKHHLRIIH